MPTWPITCGRCERGISADVVYGWPGGNTPAQQQSNARDATLWLQCPHCKKGSVKTQDGSVFPTLAAGRVVKGLPNEVEAAWKEARQSYAVGAFTASEMMCRKILMHLAVGVASAPEGKNFTEYVDALEAAGYITTGLKPVVDQVRKRGNIANHELPASTEPEAAMTATITEHLLEAIYELPALIIPPAPPASSP